MAKNLNPKCKQCRRSGEKLLLKGDRCYTAKCAMVKRNYPPGFHGPKGRRRLTEYGLQLNEKQKAKRQYNLLEKQFKLTFEKALKHTGNTAENFLKLLETRFDNIIYRLGIASSRSQARQLISHNLFTVNDKKLNIPSATISIGDVIKVKSNKKNAVVFKSLKEKTVKRDMPSWLNFDEKELTAKVLHQPAMDEIKTNFNIQMIVEYYSR